MRSLKFIICLTAVSALLASCKTKEEATPTISVNPQTLPVFEISGGSQTVTVVSNYSWEARWDAEWLTVSPSSGSAAPQGVTVTISTLSNDGKNRSAAVTFYGNNSMLVNAPLTVEQKGEKGDDDSQLVTCAQFCSLPDGTVEYRLHGAVSGSINTTYGNFDVVDATGSVYIYGCKNWADYSARVSKGDTITVKGAKTTYNGKIEMKDATIIDLADYEPQPEPQVDAVYYNNFDASAAEKKYGTSSSSWPYLDQFEGWKNQKGTGAEAVSYSFANMSTRNNSNSDGSYSDYSGSGVNNLFFGKKAYFIVKDIAVSTSDFKLSFGTEKYLQSADNTFNHSEFHVYISEDAKKWVELSYTFPNGDKNGRWDLASTSFTLPSGISKLNMAFVSDLESAHRLDDLKLEKSSSAGTKIDFASGKEIDFDGTGGGGGETPSEIKDISIKDFIATDDSTTVFRLNGIIKNVANTNYGNFDLVSTDGKDSIYIYGIVDENGAKVYTDKGLKAGDTLTLHGKRVVFNDVIEIKNAVYESHRSGGGSSSQITATHAFTSSDTLTVNSNDKSYKEVVKINDTQYTAWKMGTSSKVGVASLALKAGTKSVSFYAVGWSGKKSVVEFVLSDSVIQTVNPVANTSVSGNSPYTLLKLDDSDYYTVTFSEALASDATLTVRTTSDGYRAVVFGVNSSK